MKVTRLIDSAWEDSTPALKTVTRLALPVGFIIGVIGIVLDLTQLWGSYSFLVNLVSSLVGASFGIPIALVLLSKISHEHAEALQGKETEELKRRAAAELATACRSLLKGLFRNWSAGEGVTGCGVRVVSLR